ncbi:importin-4 [Orussus abietinus]|uniref:importin-4 n=1 Tax=Orussus abietinus TaxID=222816 RepID=UPI0006250E0B|nr:importin-4 [Orussus abietinus]
MEEILLKLLVADNNVIQQGTAELREAFKRPESTPALCQLIVSSSNPEIRQYAGLLLRKRYSKSKHWLKLPVNIRTEFKAVILQGLVNESEKSVKNSIAQLIGTIVKHELPNNSWPEVLQFVQQLVTSENLAEKELGMYTLAMMTEIAPDIYLPHIQSITILLAQTLNGLQELGSPTAFYIMRTLLHLVPVIETNPNVVNTYEQMIPQVIATIHRLAVTNQDQAIEAFELLDDLCDSAPSVITPHVKTLLNMCLNMIPDESLSESLRVKAVVFIGWLAKTKKKAIIKHKMERPIIDVLFTLMSLPSEDESDGVYFRDDDDDDNTPMACATQTLDLLALHLPPEKLIPPLLEPINAGIQGTNPYAKKASYLAIAVLAEGCSEYIRGSYLETFLRCICRGITDSAPVVRNAALFALGQFSEYLQPEISRYAFELLPVLFEYLGQICTLIKQGTDGQPSVGRIFYALEVFCTNLNEGLLPYLPTLMERLFEVLTLEKASVHVKEMALSAIGAAANASKENMLPYFEKIIALLDRYLMEKQDQSTMCLQIQAVDTLGVLARTIGEEHFAPLVERSLNYGLQLMKETEDPELKKSIYGLFASISSIMKKNMAPALAQIVDHMINSIRSTEGIVPHFKDDETSAFPVYEDLSENENEDEEDIEHTDSEEDSDDEDVAGYSVENAYTGEKEEAILALKEIAEYTEDAFLPYLEKSFEEVFLMMNYPQEDIRKAAIDALQQFCITFSKIGTNEGREATLKALSVFVPKLSELIRLDDERSVAISALDAFSELLKEIKSLVLVSEGHKDAIVNCVIEVMTGKTECQDQDEAEEENAEAEQDELLIECAGDVFTNFGKIIPPEDFACYFQTVLPLLLEKLKKNKSVAQRSFGVGTISECLSGLKHLTARFVPQLLPTFLKLANDPSSEVRNNAFYGIGELALNGKEAVYPHYSEILQALSSAIAKETYGGARDNVVGAIARLVTTNYNIIPLDQVFPVFIEQLPLKDDLNENKAVFESILVLYRDGHAILRPHMQKLLQVAIGVLHEKNGTDDETKRLVVEFLKSAQRDFPNEWNATFSEVPPEVVAEVQKAFS